MTVRTNEQERAIRNLLLTGPRRGQRKREDIIYLGTSESFGHRVGRRDDFLAAVYKGKGGKAYVAIGCRRFSFKEAYAHWNAVRTTYGGFPEDVLKHHDALKRYARARRIIYTLLPKAEKIATKQGWKLS